MSRKPHIAALTFGNKDFQGKRLHMLQIGLGTFGTFVHYLADSDDAYMYTASVDWLLSATSNGTKDISILGVAVEPVKEHLESLQALAGCHTALVNAGIRDADGENNLYTIPSTLLKRADHDVTETDTTEAQLVYLRNMSSIGAPLSEMVQRCESITCTACPRRVPTITISSLATALNFCGFEVLLVDAEGDDYRILLSLLQYIAENPSSHVQPDVIQFETMGHCDEKEKFDAESHITEKLVCRGYIVAWTGYNTVLIHSEVQRIDRIRAFSDTISCHFCSARGFPGMPFHDVYIEEAQNWRTKCNECYEAQERL